MIYKCVAILLLLTLLSLPVLAKTTPFVKSDFNHHNEEISNVLLINGYGIKNNVSSDNVVNYLKSKGIKVLKANNHFNYVNSKHSYYSSFSFNHNKEISNVLLINGYGIKNNVSSDNVVNYLKSKGIKVLKANNHLITVKASQNQLKNLQYVKAVLPSTHTFKVLSTSSLTSANSIYAPVWWDNGYNGSPVKVAVIDTGIRISHQALNTSPDRFIQRSFVSGSNGSPNDFFGHGTHITGILAGFYNLFKGIAFGITRIINAKGLNDNGAGYEGDIMNALDWAANNKTTNASILSNSWGNNTTFPDGNSSISLFVDSLADNYDKLLVFAAGNDGPFNNSISVPGDAYNVITVGAVDDNGTPNRTDDVIAEFSSRGYALTYSHFDVTNNITYYYLRKKPDIVAPGVNINSSCNYYDSSYCEMSGTSMAVPHVSGAAALLMQYGLSPKEVKALLINSAEDKGEKGWDKDYGWGYLDLQKAYLLKDYVKSGEISNYSIYYKVNVSSGDKITLVWNRHVNLSSGVNHLNDLDLYLYDSNGNSHDYSVSPVNNVEQVISDFNGEAIVKIYPYNVSDIENYSISFSNHSEIKLFEPEVLSLGQSLFKPNEDINHLIYVFDGGGIKNVEIAVLGNNSPYNASIASFNTTAIGYYVLHMPTHLPQGDYTLLVNVSSNNPSYEDVQKSFNFSVFNYTDGLSDVSFSYPGNTLNVGDDLAVNYKLTNVSAFLLNYIIIDGSNISSFYIGNVSFPNNTNSFVINKGNFTHSGYYIFYMSFNSYVNGSPYVALLNFVNSESTNGNSGVIHIIGGGGGYTGGSGSSGGGGGGSNNFISELIHNETLEVFENITNINNSFNMLNNLNLSFGNYSSMFGNITNMLNEANTTGNLSLLNEIKDLMANLSLKVPEVHLLVNRSLKPKLNLSLINNENTQKLVLNVSIVENKEVYHLIDKITNKTTAITRFTQKIKNTLRKPLKNVSLIVKIPKSYAYSVKNLTFKGDGNMIVLKEDPVVKWVFNEVMPDETKIVTYEIKKDLSNVKDVPEIAIVSEEPEKVVINKQENKEHKFNVMSVPVNNSRNPFDLVFKTKGEFYLFIILISFLLFIIFLSLRDIRKI